MPGISNPGPSPLRRVLRFCAFSLFFTTAGFFVATASSISVIDGMITPPTDADTLTMFEPQDEESRKIELQIQNSTLAQALRANPDFAESRPHMRLPEPLRSHNFTSGTLAGAGKIVVPPFVWKEKEGKSLVSIVYLGEDLCGHPGIVHGGLLATILDEGLAGCCFPALPNKMGMTVSLSINYRMPAYAGQSLVLKAKTVKVEGRKAWVEGHIEEMVDEGEKPRILVEASALFVEPRQAAVGLFYQEESQSWRLIEAVYGKDILIQVMAGDGSFG